MENKIKLEKIELIPLLEQLSMLYGSGVDYVDITLNQDTNIVHVSYKKEYLAPDMPAPKNITGEDFKNSISLN